MQRLGTESYAELARALRLSSFAAPKNIRRWLDGETKPGYESTLKLLELVGALNLEALERDLRGSGEAGDELQAEVERAGRARRLEEEGRGRAARSRRGAG